MVDFFHVTFSVFRKKNISRGDLGQHRPAKFSSRSWIRRGAIWCSPRTSYDEINDSVINSERGELVRGSDPPLVHSTHSTAGDLWRAPIRLLLKTHLVAGVKKTETKTLHRLPTGEKQNLRGCGGRPQNNTSNLSRPRAWIEMDSSALSPTLMWPCPERRGVTMGCLYLEIEGQSR